MQENILKEEWFQPGPGSMWERQGAGYLCGCGAGNGARIFLDRKRTEEICWGAYHWLSVDVCSRQEWSLVFRFEIWEKGNESSEPDITVRMSMIPGEKVRLALPFEALDAQRIFLERTPGKLRSFVTGRAVPPERIGRIAIGLREGWEEQRISVSNICLWEKEPDYPFTGKKLVDLLGQKAAAVWPGKCSSGEEMKGKIRAEQAYLEAEKLPTDRSSYGGWTKLQFEETGYFRLEKTDTRWWLVDPLGCAFLTAGMDCVHLRSCTPVDGLEGCYEWIPEKEGRYGAAWMRQPWDRESKKQYVSFPVANLIRCFGEDWRWEWEKLTTLRLKSWGFNTIGAFSDDAYVKASRMPYTQALMDYPDTQRKIYRDFPDVFSGEFSEDAKRYAAQLEELREDRNLIGYYMRNEPEWAFSGEVCLAEELLNQTAVTETRKVFLNFLKEKYDRAERLNTAWNLSLSGWDELEHRAVPEGRKLSEQAKKDLEEFSRIMIREYVKIPALALKKADPNHLNLGMRYAFILYPDQTAGCEYMDVFSINCYKIDPSPVLKKVAETVNMPMMIGEYHFGALDRGLDATGIIGVSGQKERGKAYRYYLNHALHVPECVGVQYFEYQDQALLGRPDGENYQIGFVDVCGIPYPEMTEAAREAHAHMYRMADGGEDYESEVPEKIVSNIAS